MEKKLQMNIGILGTGMVGNTVESKLTMWTVNGNANYNYHIAR